jgi:hypothetical protein
VRLEKNETRKGVFLGRKFPKKARKARCLCTGCPVRAAAVVGGPVSTVLLQQPLASLSFTASAKS